MSFAMNHLNFLEPRSAKVQCHMDKNHHQVCTKESIFHRIGRWILMAVMLFFGLIAILVLYCIIKRRRAKKAKMTNATNANYTMPQYGAPYGGAPPPVGMDSKPQNGYGAPTHPQPVH